MRYFLAMALIALAGCGPKTSEFEVMGIRIDETTLEAAQKIHPTMRCDQLFSPGIPPLMPGYSECSVMDVQVAKIRSSLDMKVNKAGVVTAVTVVGQPYDGPFTTFSQAMTEKYGPPPGEERGDPVWRASNGTATLTRTKDGGAMLVFQGKRWREDVAALDRDAEKGRKF